MVEEVGNFGQLQEEIIARSISKVWEEAKLEWEYSHSYRASDGVCLCGHNPIIEHCVLKHRTGSAIAVGNVCVKRFRLTDKDTDAIFRNIKRVAANRSKFFKEPCLAMGHAQGWVNDWELEFYTSLLKWRKKHISEKQYATKYKIDTKLLRGFDRKS